LPPQYAQPAKVTATHLNPDGAAREASESFEFDELGRLTAQVDQDGTRTETRYDDVVPEPGRPPIGLPVSQRVTAPDGLVRETRYELNPSRTAQVTTETYAGTVGDAELTRTGRREVEVDPDGFVRAERMYPQGGDGEPVVTTFTKDTDLAAGTVTTATTVAAGTDAATTTTRVADLVHGGALREIGPTGASASAVYDPLGRPVEQVDRAGNVTRIDYRTLQRHGENAVVTTRADGVVGTTTSDVLGRVVRAVDGTSYAYNARNQPVAETSPEGAVTRIGYWATGQRATRTHADSSAATVFHWDGATLLNDTHTEADATVTAGYLVGVGRHARTVAASTSYYEADFHGNITELTDESAAVTTSYDYSDYGLTTTRDHSGAAERQDGGTAPGEAQRNPFQYAGEYTDPTGTQYLHARTYDPESMRLTSIDPEPQHNRYHYAALNPISLADPTGRLPELPGWATALLAGVGLAMAGIGLGFAVSAYTTAVAIAGTTLGTKAVIAGTVVASLYDLTTFALTTAHEFDRTFLDQDVAFILSLSGAAVGGATMFTGVGSRAVARTDINALIARGADETQAVGIVSNENRIVKKTDELYQRFGSGGDAARLKKGLHESLTKEATEDGAWSAKLHLSRSKKAAKELDFDGNYAREQAGKLESNDEMPRRSVAVPDELFDDLESLAEARVYKAHWKLEYGVDLSDWYDAARTEMTKRLLAQGGKEGRSMFAGANPRVIEFRTIQDTERRRLYLPSHSFRGDIGWLNEL